MDQQTGGSKFVLGVQYFSYFGVLGIFLPYFNLYCYHLDFSGFEIGLLSAVRTITLVIFSLLWGVIADRLHARKQIFVIASVVSTGIWAFFLGYHDFISMLIIMIFYGIFYSPIIAFLEAFSMDLLGKDKKNYGRIRVWGSIGFILVVLCLGKVISDYSIEIIVFLILAGSVFQAFFSVFTPAVKSTQETVQKVVSNSRFWNLRLFVFLFTACLMLVSHGTYYGFFSIHLEKLGYGGVFIGFAWALASLSEIIVMVRSKAILSRFSYENLLLFSLFIASLRWGILFFAEDALLILFSQLLHAVTYGVFHISSILYIDSLSKDGGKTLGQAVNNSVSYGLGMMIGFLVNGYLFDDLGKLLFVYSAVVALIAAVIFGSYQKFFKHFEAAEK